MEYLEWSPDALAKIGLSDTDVADVTKTYTKLYEAERAELTQNFQAQILELEKIGDPYVQKLTPELKRNGLDLSALQAELKKIAKLKDFTRRAQRVEKLKAKYAPFLEKALGSLGIDPADVRKEIIAAVSPPKNAYIQKHEFFAISYGPYLMLPLASEAPDESDDRT